MLKNAYFLAKIGADTAENEQHSAEKFPTNCNHESTTRAELAEAHRVLEEGRGAYQLPRRHRAPDGKISKINQN